LTKLGRHSMGKSCLYFKHLAELDVKVLEALIAGSIAEVRRRYPHAGDVSDRLRPRRAAAHGER